MNRHRTKLIRENDYLAEVEVELLEEADPPGWGPYYNLEDALKLDDVRNALRAGDVARARPLARNIYRLHLIA